MGKIEYHSRKQRAEGALLFVANVILVFVEIIKIVSFEFDTSKTIRVKWIDSTFGLIVEIEKPHKMFHMS